jgi:hypothetical protein
MSRDYCWSGRWDYGRVSGVVDSIGKYEWVGEDCI